MKYSAPPPSAGDAGSGRNDRFSFKKIPMVFASLPRVFYLVWSTSPLFTIILVVLTLAQGFIPAIRVEVNGMVVDSVVRAIRIQNPAPIWLPVGLQLGISLVSSLLRTFNGTVQSLLQERVSNRIQLMILQKASRLDLAFFENPDSYDMLRQAALQSGHQPVSMISQAFTIVRTIITIGSLFFVLIHLAWWLSIVALIAPIPSFISSTRYSWHSYQIRRQQMMDRRLMSYFVNLLTSDGYHKEIQIFHLGDYFTGMFWYIATKLYAQFKSLVLGRSLTGYVWSSITVIANSIIYIYVALHAVYGQISLGELILYTQTAMSVGDSFQSLLHQVSSTYENTLFIGKLFSFLGYVPGIVSPPDPQPFVHRAEQRGLTIEFRNVTFTYPGKEKAALKNVSFIIQPGESIALVGRNGAGKTTLVKLLARLYDPDAGEILLDGRNIKEYDLMDLRAQIGVIFQDYVHYQLTARENIGVGRLERIHQMSDVMEAANKSGAHKFIRDLPLGYNTLLGRQFGTIAQSAQLSGGEWQKIALARAFMRDAPLLILDEPTSSLDAQAEHEVFQQFRELTLGKTAIFISHRFSTVRLADRIFVLKHGSVVEQGSHEELMALGGQYAYLFDLQARAYR